MQQAIAVYSSDELDIDEGGGGDNNVHLKNWLAEGKHQFDVVREVLRYLCEPVPLPREMEQYLRYFCGNAADPNALNDTEAEAAALRNEVEFYGNTRSAIKKHSGEELDIKPYEADMRHLINTYIQADPAADLGGTGRHVAHRADHRDRHPRRHREEADEKGKLSKNAIAEGIIFHPQGQISPGKNAILHRTTAAFTSPGLWPQELRSHMPARPGRRRLGCGSCPSAHGLRSTLPPHARSPSRSCASLASLWPARPGTCTPKIAPMLGVHEQMAPCGAICTSSCQT